MSDEIQVFKIGHPFSPDRSRWPVGPHLWMDEDGIRLALFLPDPSPAEIHEVYHGKIRFAWVERQMSGFLVFKIGQMPWADAPFSPGLALRGRTLELMERGLHHPVHLFLVDADSGILRGMRFFTWPAYFVNTVVESVRRIAARPFNNVAALAEQDQLYAQYPNGPSIARLVKAEALATCLGGQRHDKPI